MAQLNNVRLIYREAKKHDRVLQLDQLSITPGKEGLLALEGAGKVDVYPLSLKGEAGPIKSLLSARDMRVAMQGVLGKLALDIHGVVGSLDPLDGADLTLKIEHPELGGMLEKLEVPVVVTGPAQIDARLKDAGERTQLDFNAKAGDFTVVTSGTLKSLSLTSADLTLKIEHTEIGSLLKTLELPAIATGPMRDRHPNQGCRSAPAARLQGKARRHRRQLERHAQDARSGGFGPQIRRHRRECRATRECV